MTSGGLSTAFQVVLSLAIVIAVVVVGARLARRAGIKGPGAGLRVLDRTGLSREASVAVVAVDDRRLVLGVTAHGVTLLTELPATPEPPATPAPPSGDQGTLRDQGILRDQGTLHTEEALGLVDVTGAPVPAGPASSSALALPRQAAPAPSGTTRPARPARQAQGSVLSPATWKQGVEALRELTTRKS